MSVIKVKRGFAVIAVLFCISAVTPLLVPLSTGSDGRLNTIGYLTGIMFWAGLAGGIIGYLILCRKAGRRAGKENGKGKQRKGLPSALRFFSNPPAGIMDGVLIVGAAGTIWSMSNARAPAALATVFLILLLAGIYAHFLLNGALFQYIWTQESRRAEGSRREGIRR